MSVISSIISGAIGGFAATSLGTIAVQWFTRPVLEFNNGITKEGSSPYEEKVESAEYEVQIQNTGRSVATNCKPRITLEGSHKTTINEFFAVEGGYEPSKVDITKKYSINIIPEWNEKKSSSRLGINQDEYVSFRLFEANSESVGPQTHDKIRFGSILPKQEMAEKDGIYSKPIRVETPSYRMSTEPSVTFESSITRETFAEIDWKIKEVAVTSAESKKISGEIVLEWEGGNLPDVSIE